MSRQTVENENIRNLTTVGGSSLCVVIPARIVRKLKLKPKNKVKINKLFNRIIIKKI